MMHAISYISSVTVPENQLKNAVLSIAEAAQHRNRMNDITGVLFYANNHFFQTIEGTEYNLRQLFTSIEKDHRHTGIVKLIDEPISVRSYSDWALDTFFVDNPELINPQTIEMLQEIYLRNFDLDLAKMNDFVKRMIDEMDTFKILATTSGDPD